MDHVDNLDILHHLDHSDQSNHSDNPKWSMINQKDNCRIRIVYLVLFTLFSLKPRIHLKKLIFLCESAVLYWFSMCQSWKGQILFPQSHCWRNPNRLTQACKTARQYFQRKLSHRNSKPFLAGALSYTELLETSERELDLGSCCGISTERRTHVCTCLHLVF